MNPHLPRITVIFILVLSSINSANAAIIYESATMGPTGQYSGYGIDSYSFLGSRFYIANQVQVTAIGGHLASTLSGGIFGAIVKMSSSTDLPNGTPFDGAEVVAYKVFSPNYTSSDFRTQLSVTLDPGYYALVFGSGLYGATGEAIMPVSGQTDTTGATYFFWDGYYDYTWYEAVPFQGRFVVEGTIIPGYCAASGGCDEYISGVQVGSINNTGTGCSGGYASYTTMMTTMEIGKSYAITVTNGSPYTGDRCGIWVDWNQDLDFADTGETITVNGGPSVFTATITPPAGAVIGKTRLRVRIVYNETPSSCGASSYGETEDYTINVTNPSVTTLNISGCIKTAEGVRIKGVNVSASTGQSTVTDALGNYSLTLPNPFNGSITPSQTDWTFSPPITYYAAITDLTNMNYTGTYNMAYGGGSGTSSTPYLIYNAAQLNAIGAKALDWDKYFKLMANIDLVAYDGKAGRPSFNRIGFFFNDSSDIPFTGVFDGNNCTISNFTFDSNAGNDGVGIFGGMDSVTSLIKNVKLVNVDVNSISVYGTGAIVGWLSNGTISGCSVQNGTVFGGDEVGGLVGMFWEGNISGCSAGINVTGAESVGGILGETGTTVTMANCGASCNVAGQKGCGGLAGKTGSHLCTITASSSTGSVTASGSEAGGLVGDNSGTIDRCYSTVAVYSDMGSEIGGLAGRNLGSISNSYTMGSVSGLYPTGGFIGFNWKTPSTEGSVTNCYSTGVSNGCGFIGDNYEGVITDSFWDTDTSGTIYSAGGTGKTTVQMKTKSTFTDAGWNFINETSENAVWSIAAGDYPRLCWETGIDYGGGTGAQDNPYSIYTAAQMNKIGLDANDWNKSFKLMADIDLGTYTGTSFNRIGRFEVVAGGIVPFNGTFDGGGHTVSNFTYKTTDACGVGLFGGVGRVNGATTIKNLILVDPNVDAGTGGNIGALVGVWYRNGTMSDCQVIGGSVKGKADVGGLIGFDYYGIIKRCRSSANVTATSIANAYAGGLIGVNNFGEVNQCCSSGTVTSNGLIAGGLVGTTSTSAIIKDCYSSASVAGPNFVGGLIGYNAASVTNCYAVGKVSGPGIYTHGLTGAGGVTSGFWDINTSGDPGPWAGTGLSTVLMKTLSTYTDANWDFNNVWSICEGTNYPKFQWQILPGDIVCPDGVDFEDLAELCGQWLFERIPADLAPPGGDGIVNFDDFSVFADKWNITVGIDDLFVFAEQWLKTGLPVCSADISSDGRVNELDLAIMGKNWFKDF